MKMNKEVVMVRLSDIIPNRFQPRLTFDEEALNELASSIKEHGIIQPLILRDLGSKYEIIAGERRYKASTLAGLTEVPAIIGSMDDQTSAELALIENIQRKDLSAIEEAKSYKKILDMGNFTQEELAKRMGKGQSTIANKMRLLSLTNEVQVALMNNLISERHARCLLQIKDEDLQKEVLNKVIAERMNVRDTDEYIKNVLGINNNILKTDPQNNVNVDNNNTMPKDIVIPSEPILNINSSTNVDSVLESKTPIEDKVDDNPNVYAQNKNDFVNIDNLTKPTNDLKTIEVPELNIQDDKTDNLNEGTLNSVKDKKVDMNNSIYNMEKIASVEQKPDNMTKVKLATAIRLAKDTVDDIISAGYNVTMEEKDGLTDYQIIIKVQK